MLLDAVKTGAKRGFSYSLMLIRIIIPVYIAITVAKHTPFMDWLSLIFEPVMGLFHLPGEAAVPFITGLFLDEYAAIAAIKAVGLVGFEISVAAIMTIIAHSLFIESAIIKKLELSITFFAVYRLIFAIALGILFGFIGEVFFYA